MAIINLKTTALTVALACTIVAKAQDYATSCITYKWNETPVNYQPDSADKASPMVYVLYKRINEYVDNEKTGQLDAYYGTHNMKYVNDDKSVEENNKLYIPTWETQNLVSIHTRAIKNGKVVFEATEKDFIQVEEDGSKYNMIAIKGLEKGMMVETVTIMRLVDYDLYGNEYFQVGSPVKQAEFYLITPERLEFKCKAYNRFNAITDSVSNERHVYFGATKNILAFDEEEKYSLENANKARVEYVFHKNTSTNKLNAKWPELGRIFFDRMSYNYDKHQKDLSKILAKIDLKSAKTELEKVFMIENYLKTTISVNNDVTDGETYAETVKKKVASPFRFNQIMAQTFRLAGVNVEYILTCKKDYKRFDPELDSWSYLRNVLFYSPATKQYIDPQEPLKRIGSIGNSFLNQHGLFIKLLTIGDVTTATASVKLIPGNEYQGSIDAETYDITFNSANDKINFNYNRKMHGYAEQGIKGYYYIMNDENKKTFIEGFVKGLAKDATIESIAVENYNPTVLDEVNKPLVINAKMVTDYYLEPVGNNILFKVGEVIGQQSEMYVEKPRVNPIDIEWAHQYNRVITITLPDGYQAKGLEKLNMDYQFKNSSNQPSYGFTSTYKLEGNKLTIYCNEYYNDLNYPMEAFANFKKVVNAAADFNKISILLEKK